MPVVSTRHFKRDGGGLAAERGGESGYRGGDQRVSDNMKLGRRKRLLLNVFEWRRMTSFDKGSLNCRSVAL